jgi:hypothetical protein
MQADNSNGFKPEHLRKWWQATRDALFADLKSLLEPAAQAADERVPLAKEVGWKSYTSVLWIGLALAGCAIGPDFKAPAAPDAAGYTAVALPVQTVAAPTDLGGAQRFVAGAPIAAEWWRQFGSAKLDALVETALRASPTLEAAEATLRQARQNYEAKAGTTQYPQANANLGAQRQGVNNAAAGLPGGERTGSLYKREEDGIVLVDQDKCRGWRMCISSCPYKKVFYNWESGKAEKCIGCYPRVESGMPTVCSESCVGRIRYNGIMLYDADKIDALASVPNEQDLYQAQLDIFLDPNDPEVIKQARIDGIPEDWMEAARNSPIYKMAVEWKIAFPMHPEFRTLPMVWYVPPLSPVQSHIDQGGLSSDPGSVIPPVENLRLPVKYLANLLTAGKEAPIVSALKRMIAMRAYQRSIHVEGIPDTRALDEIGMSVEMALEMYRYLAIANYEDRFVIPTGHQEVTLEDFYGHQGQNGFTFGNDSSPGISPNSLFPERRKETVEPRDPAPAADER